MLAKAGMDKKGDAERLRLLFVNIVTQAVKDAFLRHYENRSAAGTNKVVRNQAIFWLTEDTKDFYEICEYAGISADRIRNKSKELLKMPENIRIAHVRKMIANQGNLSQWFPVYK